MANFAKKVYQVEVGCKHNFTSAEIVQSLQVATALWVRSLPQNELGLHNFISLLVPRENFLYFPCTETCEFIFSNCGRLISEKIPGLPCVMWASTGNHRGVNLDYFKFVSNECRIHISWLEHALALAYTSMYNSGHTVAKQTQTIAGLEKVDWL